jgi:hypothetical protein
VRCAIALFSTASSTVQVDSLACWFQRTSSPLGRTSFRWRPSWRASLSLWAMRWPRLITLLCGRAHQLEARTLVLVGASPGASPEAGALLPLAVAPPHPAAAVVAQAHPAVGARAHPQAAVVAVAPPHLGVRGHPSLRHLPQVAADCLGVCQVCLLHAFGGGGVRMARRGAGNVVCASCVSSFTTGLRRSPRTPAPSKRTAASPLFAELLASGERARAYGWGAMNGELAEAA